MTDSTSTASVIRLERRIKQPPAAVWKALTTPELIAKWWAPGDIRAEVGHRFTLDMGKWGQQPCEVKAVDHEKKLVYTFILNTTVTWELIPEAGGTLLVMTHDGFDPDSPVDRQAFEGVSGGWPVIMGRLDAHLAA
jgi:uncharacterized protein YndB with AHSA1/START domain